VNTTPTKQRGVYAIIERGVHRGKLACIERVCNHSWYELAIAAPMQQQMVTLHTSYFRVATPEENESNMPADPLAHLMGS